jgi:ribosomal protein S18 acetylase RimI-like enzyme
LRESVSIRLLQAGDEPVVERLATREPRTALLADPRTMFLVAFDDHQPVGFLLAYELPRRHGLESMLLVYEIEVDERYRRRGIARDLFAELERHAHDRGIGEAFVLTEPDNDAANALYRSVGGRREDVVQWDIPYTAG